MSQEVLDSKEKDLTKVSFVICDWDGTLVDSMPAYVRCFVKALEEFGIDPDILKNYYMSTSGTPLHNQIRDVVKKFAGKDLTDSNELEKQFFDHYLQMGDIQTLDGAKDTLVCLKKNGYKIVVWSGTRTDILGNKLKQTRLGDYVDFYIGNVPGDDRMVKGPGPFAQIAKHFQIPVKKLQRESIVIGDRIGDIEAGKNSGTRTIGLGPQREKLAQAGADFTISNIDELPSLFKL